MKNVEFSKNKHKIWIYCGIYAVVCEVISLIFLGFRYDFAVGILAGTLTVLVNFTLLERFTTTFLVDKKALTAFLLQLGRYLLFGLVAILCIKINLLAGLGYSIGILGITIGIVIEYGIGGSKNEY
ncbi:MAG TPA: hypothetical protein VJY37_03515 [Anaerovoracaceae bacterium]|nr:hypothetical protein [Anaerovoracaceae bacterium]